MPKYIWNHDKIAYGGDYNPEQWPRETWLEDMKMFKEAGIDTVTLNVFSWAKLQPSEETYDFTLLDEIMNLVKDNQLKVCLATSTAAHPAWMAKKYPEILRTDFQGRKHKFGGRHNSCPNSPVYRKYSSRMAEMLAKRYGSFPNLLGWHVSNEYGGECYCENCEKAFQQWLQERYQTVEQLNQAWNTSFWGHTFYAFDEVVVPNLLSEHFELYGQDRTQFQPISIDYRRFMSDSMLACYRLEYDAIKSITPNIPITTNLMGFYKPLDYQKWSPYLDFIAWDNYPAPEDSPAKVAMNHDLMRGLKGGAPFSLMEQTPSVTNWHPYNALKRPGVMRLLSYQAVAHGADTVMFFQMRRSIGACEKYHGAVIDHAGRNDTRVFREISTLGDELKKLGNQTLGGRAKSKVAIVFDWDNWWSVEYSAGPSILLKYYDEVLRYYEALHSLNISVDVIGMEDDLSEYKMVIAPVLYMVKNHFDEKIRDFVRTGGTFITTYFSGYVNETDLVMGAYPGCLSDILGIWVEESDALPEGMKNSFVYNGKEYDAKILLDIVRPEGAKSLAVYESDFYKGETVLTEHTYGEGNAYYVGCSSEHDFYKDFLKDLCEKNQILAEFHLYPGIEAVRRYSEGYDLLYLMNHLNQNKEIYMEYDCCNILNDTIYKKDEVVELRGKDVLILKRME